MSERQADKQTDSQAEKGHRNIQREEKSENKRGTARQREGEKEERKANMKEGEKRAREVGRRERLRVGNGEGGGGDCVQGASIR